MIPLWVAFCFFFIKSHSKKRSGRILLTIGVTLAIVSITLYAIWSIVYIFKFYKEDVVYEGWGDKHNPHNYTKISKKNYLIRELCTYISILAFLSYSLYSCHKWQNIADIE